MASFDGFSGQLELSEFSSYEILYMSREDLTFVIEQMVGAEFSDPFELVAAIEEALGFPLVQLLKETPM